MLIVNVQVAYRKILVGLSIAVVIEAITAFDAGDRRRTNPALRARTHRDSFTGAYTRLFVHTDQVDG
jgi:hypothetical protein